ncbi:DNA polymerase delta small subunit [Diutina catenulata]
MTTEHDPTQRAAATVEATQHFAIPTGPRDYQRQFFSMYDYRFQHLRQRVYHRGVEKWGNGTKALPNRLDGPKITKKEKILDIAPGEVCWVVGTIFCELKNKSNILKDVEHGVDDVLPSVPATYTSDDTVGAIMIEDESGRVILHGDDVLGAEQLVTGCTVAVLGVEVNAGVFEVLDVVHPEPIALEDPVGGRENGQRKETSDERNKTSGSTTNQSANQTTNQTTNQGSNQPSTQPSTPSTSTHPGPKVLLVSGMAIADGDTASDLRLELLKQYVLGETGDPHRARLIAEVVVVGDSIAAKHEVVTDSFVSSNNYGSKNTSKFSPASLAKFDAWVSELGMSVPVSVMPGALDPAEICWSQPPLHRSVMPRAARSQGFTRLTNPQYLHVSADTPPRRVLLSSGQNVADIQRYARPSPSPLAVMERQITWQNIAPTAPDTLYCYPYTEFDPFIFTKPEHVPHVYVVGNQSEYAATTAANGTRLVTVPRFAETGHAVLLDLATGATEPVVFECM